MLQWSCDSQQRKESLLSMNSTTQNMKSRQSLLQYAEKYGVARASRKYNKTRSSIYFWRKRYDGAISSLACYSRRPHHHPREHTPDELKFIRDMHRRNPRIGLVDLWCRLRKRGYTRCIESLYRVIGREGMMADKKVRKEHKFKPYESMDYPGQRILIDTKVVPRQCIPDKGLRLFQYTAIDEYSHLRILGAYPEQSTHSSADFLKKVVAAFAHKGVKVECVQTDNGCELINRFVSSRRSRLTLFEQTATLLGIHHKLIRPYTPATMARLNAVTGKTRNASTILTLFLP